MDCYLPMRWCMHSLIQKVLTEHLVCTRHYSTVLEWIKNRIKPLPSSQPTNDGQFDPPL